MGVDFWRSYCAILKTSLTVPECLDSNSCQECFYHLFLPKSLQPFLSEVGLKGFSVPPPPPEEISGVHGIWKLWLPWKVVAALFKENDSSVQSPEEFGSSMILKSSRWMTSNCRSWCYSKSTGLEPHVHPSPTLNLEGVGYKDLGNFEPMGTCFTCMLCTFWAFDTEHNIFLFSWIFLQKWLFSVGRSKELWKFCKEFKLGLFSRVL